MLSPASSVACFDCSDFDRGFGAAGLPRFRGGGLEEEAADAMAVTGRISFPNDSKIKSNEAYDTNLAGCLLLPPATPLYWIYGRRI